MPLESNKIIRFVDLYGNFGERGVAHYYVFCNGNEELSTADRKYFNDLRELPKSVGKAYTTFCSPAGWWLGRVGHNPHDPRHGYAMVSVCLGEHRPAQGNAAIGLLDALFDLLVVKRLWSDVYTRDTLASHRFEYISTPLLLSNLEKSGGRGAYRTYDTAGKLANYMEAILQLGHDEFARVFFIEDRHKAAVEGFVTPVSTPFKMLYSITCEDPRHTRVSHTEALTGESITVEYSNDADSRVLARTFIAGTPSDLISINGATITVLSPEKSGMRFAKNIKLRVKWDNAPQGLTAPSPDNELLQHQHLTFNASTGELHISAESPAEITLNFHSWGFEYYSTVIKNNDTLKNGSAIFLELKPKRLPLIFKVGDKTYTADKRILYLSPEYLDLTKSGARITGQGLEMKGEGFPVKTETEPEVKEPVTDHSRKAIIVGGAVALLCLFIISLIIHNPDSNGIKVDKEKIEIVETSDYPTLKEDDKTMPAENYSSTESSLEEDIDYMKNNDIWERSKLKSQIAVTFFDALASAASPAEIASLRYPSSSTVNGYWTTLQQNCKKIKGANEIMKFSANLRKFVSPNKIDLKQLSSASANALKRDNDKRLDKENHPQKYKQESIR